MLRDSDRLYFIHIPKTAGTSLIAHLDMHFGIDEICPAQLWRELAELPVESLPAYRLFRGHFGGNGLDHFLPEPPKCITMVRKPIPTAISRYEFILREPGIPVHELVTRSKMSFSDFVNHPETRSQISNTMVRNLSFDLNADPNGNSIFPAPESRQYIKKWIKNHRIRLSPEQRLDRAKAKLEECVFFGLAERFEESMELLSHTFGWSPAGKIQKLRVSTGKSHRKAIPTGTFREIEELNEMDMELYRYAEERFEEKLSAMRSRLEALAQTDMKSMDTDRLMDTHYIRCSYDGHRSPATSLRYDFSGALNGTGWHARETARADNSIFRWTGPGRQSRLDLELDRRSDLLLTVRIVNTVDLSLLKTLRLKVNNHLVKLRTLDGNGTPVRVLQGIIPTSFLNSDRPFTRFVLEVDHVGALVSKNPLIPDKRLVGVAVNWIDIRPASQKEVEEIQSKAPPVLPRPSRIRAGFHKTRYGSSILRTIGRVKQRHKKRNLPLQTDEKKTDVEK